MNIPEIYEQAGFSKMPGPADAFNLTRAHQIDAGEHGTWAGFQTLTVTSRPGSVFGYSVDATHLGLDGVPLENTLSSAAEPDFRFELGVVHSEGLDSLDLALARGVILLEKQQDIALTKLGPALELAAVACLLVDAGFVLTGDLCDEDLEFTRAVPNTEGLELTQVIATYKEPVKDRISVRTDFYHDGGAVEVEGLGDSHFSTSTADALRHGLATAERLMKFRSELLQELGSSKPAVVVPAVKKQTSLAKVSEKTMSEALSWLESKGAVTREMRGTGGARALQWLLDDKIMAQVNWEKSATLSVGSVQETCEAPAIQAMGLSKDFEAVKLSLEPKAVVLTLIPKGKPRQDLDR